MLRYDFTQRIRLFRLGTN